MPTRKLSFWSMNAASGMREIQMLQPKSILLTSGTLSPMLSFQAEMGINFGPKATDVLDRGAGSGFIGKYGGDIDLNATGLSSVLRAQNDGMSTKDIASQDLNFGPEALKYLTEANKPKPEPPKMYKPQMMSVGNVGNAGGVRPKTNKNSKDVTGYSRDKLKKKGSSTTNTPVMSILGLNI